MTLEQILVVAVLVLVPLLNFLARALRRHLPGPTAPEPGAGAPEPPAPSRPLPLPLGALRGEVGGIPRRLTLPPPTDGPRRRPKARIGGVREARRAIVLLAVLGPCRGLDPPPRPARGGLRDG